GPQTLLLHRKRVLKHSDRLLCAQDLIELARDIKQQRFLEREQVMPLLLDTVGIPPVTVDVAKAVEDRVGELSFYVDAYLLLLLAAAHIVGDILVRHSAPLSHHFTQHCRRNQRERWEKRRGGASA